MEASDNFVCIVKISARPSTGGINGKDGLQGANCYQTDTWRKIQFNVRTERTSNAYARASGNH